MDIVSIDIFILFVIRVNEEPCFILLYESKLWCFVCRVRSWERDRGSCWPRCTSALGNWRKTWYGKDWLTALVMLCTSLCTQDNMAQLDMHII